jgi:putative oxidoreductase
MGRIYGEFCSGRVAIGLLLIRLIFGAGLMMHGLSKISKPFNWMDKPGKISDIPGWMQAIAAVSEFGGGAALLVGLLTPLACLGIAGTMLGAYFISHKGDPWVAPGKPNFELAGVYFTVAVALLFTGPGMLSFDSLLFGGQKRLSAERLARMNGKRQEK